MSQKFDKDFKYNVLCWFYVCYVECFCFFLENKSEICIIRCKDAVTFLERATALSDLVQMFIIIIFFPSCFSLRTWETIRLPG